MKDVIIQGGRQGVEEHRQRLLIEAKGFTCWLAGNMANKHTYYGYELKKALYFWLKIKDREFLQQFEKTPLTVIRMFLGHEKGGNAYFQERDMPEITEILTPVYISHLNKE